MMTVFANVTSGCWLVIGEEKLIFVIIINNYSLYYYNGNGLSQQVHALLINLFKQNSNKNCVFILENLQFMHVLAHKFQKINI